MTSRLLKSNHLYRRKRKTKLLTNVANENSICKGMRCFKSTHTIHLDSGCTNYQKSPHIPTMLREHRVLTELDTWNKLWLQSSKFEKHMKQIMTSPTNSLRLRVNYPAMITNCPTPRGVLQASQMALRNLKNVSTCFQYISRRFKAH